MEQIVVGAILAGDEVGIRVVIPYLVDMVNDRECRQVVAESFLDDEDVLKDVMARRGRARMAG